MIEGFFCHRAMSFSLKNPSATYQRIVNKVFKEHLGRNIKVCMDAKLVKNMTFDEDLLDLQEFFFLYYMHIN
jgi:hypothetical protein